MTNEIKTTVPTYTVPTSLSEFEAQIAAVSTPTTARKVPQSVDLGEIALAATLTSIVALGLAFFTFVGAAFHGIAG